MLHHTIFLHAGRLLAPHPFAHIAFFCGFLAVLTDCFMSNAVMSLFQYHWPENGLLDTRAFGSILPRIEDQYIVLHAHGHS